MAFIELLRNRRSIRKYIKQSLDKETLALLAEALLRSPSSRGINPWQFIFVDAPELLDKLSHAKRNGAEFLAEAALAVVIVGDDRKTDVWTEDCSIAALIAQLAAQDMGLGSCWVQIRLRPHNDAVTAEEYVQRLLGIPENLRVDMIIGIGLPGEIKKPVSREKLDFTKIHRNRFRGAPS